MKTKHLLFAMLCGLGLFTQACKKDSYTPEPEPTQTHQFQINFQANTLAFSTVDSTVVILKKPNAAAIITRKMTKGDAMFYLDNVDLQNVQWNATLNVYTAKAAGDQASRMYTYQGTVTQKMAPIDGPNGKYADTWKPRVVVTDAVRKIQLIVAERPDDPYFAIKAANHSEWEYAYVERGTETATGNTDQGAQWQSYDEEGNAVLFVNNQDVENTTAFAPFAAFMQGKLWTKGYFLIQVLNTSEDEASHVTVYYPYDKRPQ